MSSRARHVLTLTHKIVLKVLLSMKLKIDNKFETQKGNLCVVIEGYKCSKSRTMEYENIYLKCTNHNCKSSVKPYKNRKQIISVNNEHNHPI